MTALLDVTESAAMLGLTPQGVASLVYAGHITPTNRHAGGPTAWLFTAEEVERRRLRRLETMRASGRGVMGWGGRAEVGV